MTITCLSFAAGLANNDLVVERFKSNARSSGFFDNIYVVSGGGDEIFDRFMALHGNFVSSHKRGYGYWVWKPFVVREFARSLPLGAIIFYCDVGCEFSPFGVELFREFQLNAESQPIVAFQAGRSLLEYQWSKAELLDFFRAPTVHLVSPQIAATFFFLKVNEFTLEFLEQWYEIAISNDYKFIDDTLAYSREGFIAHRHDQSIFSLLLKRLEIIPYRLVSNFPDRVYYDNSHVFAYPIHAIRNLTSHSKFHGASCQIPSSRRTSVAKFFVILIFTKMLRKLESLALYKKFCPRFVS